MKKYLMIILFSIGCFTIIIGCAGRNKIEIQKKLMTMSDKELINHYEMIEMRMMDIDSKKDHSIIRAADLKVTDNCNKIQISTY